MFREPFEFVVVPGEEAGEGAPEAVLRDLREAGIDEQAEASTISWGYGADILATSVILTGLSALFLSGKRIEENLDAWVRLGRRLKAAVQKLRAKQGPVSVSEPAAVALTLARVAERETTLGRAELLGSSVAKLQNRSLSPEAAAQFSQHPERYYIFTVGVEDRAYVICMSSSGRLVFEHVLDLEDWRGFYPRSER